MPCSTARNSNATHPKDKKQAVTSFDPLPSQSLQTDSAYPGPYCTVIYCSNDNVISTTAVMGRSFLDFVAQKDKEIVRSWIDVIKSWGVNEQGQPSDNGFGFSKVTRCKEGRDSSCRSALSVRLVSEPPSRRRQGSYLSEWRGSGHGVSI
jgi:hypothetical protein